MAGGSVRTTLRVKNSWGTNQKKPHYTVRFSSRRLARFPQYILGGKGGVVGVGENKTLYFLLAGGGEKEPL